MSTEKPPNPERLFQALSAYQQTAAMKAAIELGLFTAVAEGAASPESIGRKVSASPKGVRVLCDYLTIMGFLSKNGESYGLAPDSSLFLDRHSPAYMGGVTDFLLHPMFTAHFEDLTAAVRNGGTVKGQGTMDPDHPIWRRFARAMVPMVTMAAEGVAGLVAANGKASKVLDIAAGHGLFGISIARRNPNARIVACDWASVLEIAQEHAHAAEVADRFELLSGSAFEVDFGSGFDLVLFPNFFHHFDKPSCESLMRKAHAALKPGGQAVTVEFIPNPDRVSPPAAGAFALMMLGTTARGDAYTFEEYQHMFSNAGFSSSEIFDLPPTPHRAVISKK